MDFEPTDLYPNEDAQHGWTKSHSNLWQPWPKVEELKGHAKAAGSIR
jgi:hypothetical protein